MFSNHTDSPTEELFYPDLCKNGVRVFIKRDDLIHPIISGNKWRKLKYVLADAALNNCNHLVSFGGAYSNHLLALACAGAISNVKTTAFVRGEEVSNHVLALCKLYGMALIFVSREAYKNKQQLYKTFASQHKNTYFIDEGGKGLLAAKGCEEILANANGFSHVVCAVGTGTTLAGIAKAALVKNMTAEGICVLKGAEQINEEISALAGFEVTIHHGFSEGGYAKYTPELLQFMKKFVRQTGILLDHVYTAKLLFALTKLIAQKHYPFGSNILAVHTGGIMGLLSIVDEL